MVMSRSRRIAAGLVTSCLAGGLGAIALQGGAPARADEPVPVPDVARDSAPAAEAAEPEEAGAASVSSPYVAGVPHVPADVVLILGPGGQDDSARFAGPEGSLFNGAAAEVERRVDAWWAEQMAAGLSPEEADAKLASP